MKQVYCVFFVPNEGVHPCASLADYAKLWPVMHDSVRQLGHEVTHLTDMRTESWGDHVFRVDVDAKTTVRSRDIVWAEFVRQLGPDETAIMIEPDTVMVRPIPDLRDGCDLVILRRPGACVSGGFKMARRSAAPFFDAVVRQYGQIDPSQHPFHGDVLALHRTLGIKPGKTADNIPDQAEGCRIDVREFRDYGWRGSRAPYLLQFKGASKSLMLRLGSDVTQPNS